MKVKKILCDNCEKLVEIKGISPSGVYQHDMITISLPVDCSGAKRVFYDFCCWQCAGSFIDSHIAEIDGE